MRFSCAVRALICACGILCHRGKYALKTDYLRHARRRPKYCVGVFAIFARASGRCPAVWLHSGLLVGLLQNIRSTFEHAPRPLALFYTFGAFLSVCLVCVFGLSLCLRVALLCLSLSRFSLSISVFCTLFFRFSLFPSFPSFPSFPCFPCLLPYSYSYSYSLFLIIYI